jgi:Organic solvent tolerance protein OstA
LLKISPYDSKKIHKNQTELSYSNLFKLNKINTHDEVDTGSSLILSFDFKTSKINPINGAKNDKFKFSIEQFISAKENQDMPSKTTLNEKLSNVVGKTSLNLNENVKLSTSFLLNQNLEDFNKNKVEIDFNYPKTSFNLNYLEEDKHIGSQEYLQTKVGLDFTKRKLSFDAKRNLLSNSAEFYDLSYEYINDCLRAVLPFTTQFYIYRGLEPKDSLIFNVLIAPLGTITTPSY